MIQFEILGEPRPKLRPRASSVQGKARIHKDPKSAKWTEAFRIDAEEHLPGQPLTGPVQLGLLFVFDVPASWPQWKRKAAMLGSYNHVTRPDADNLAKLVMDAMDEFWKDDTQVVTLVATKCYGHPARTKVTLYELDQAEREE